MTSHQDLLIIASSNGENLKLAKRFVELAQDLNIDAELLDLTTLEIPLFNPRTKDKIVIPEITKSLNNQLSSSDHWIICAPEYNGSIPPILSNAIAWLSVQGEDFRNLFNGRPIALASYSGGGCMELLLSMRIQLSHLGAQVLGRQLASNKNNLPKDESINQLLMLLMQMKPLKIKK